MDHNGAMGQYLTRFFNGKSINQRVDDGFVDATTMSINQGSELYKYNRTKRAKKYEKAVIKTINVMKVISTLFLCCLTLETQYYSFVITTVV